MGVVEMIKKAMSMPLTLLDTLSIFKSPKNEDESLEKGTKMVINVDCSFENILLNGRYIKLSRECS